MEILGMKFLRRCFKAIGYTHKHLSVDIEYSWPKDEVEVMISTGYSEYNIADLRRIIKCFFPNDSIYTSFSVIRITTDWDFFKIIEPLYELDDEALALWIALNK